MTICQRDHPSIVFGIITVIRGVFRYGGVPKYEEVVDSPAEYKSGKYLHGKGGCGRDPPDGDPVTRRGIEGRPEPDVLVGAAQGRDDRDRGEAVVAITRLPVSYN